ncbi:MAG TPA: undecaprenyl-diphosphate phosphatase [Vicinamibacteria bacterium]|nr:undecaprenyl-diphosphate phosphatase [Vicinamibacteria bacterium]
MTDFQAIVLGILQGLGEFLPISSSAHLIVFPWLVGWPDHGLAFDVALHVGTLAAVVYAFIGDWWRIVTSALKGLLHGHPGEGEGRLLWLLILASIPGAVVGLALGEAAETTFRSPLLIAVTLSVVAAVLLVADRRADKGDEHRKVTVRDAVLIGLAQAVAIIPGVSRSGATISMALFLGYGREEAARFSFLMATPIIFGAALTKVPQLLRAPDHGPVLLGMLASAVVGLAAIRLLLTYVRTRNYRPFVYYRWAFSALIVTVYLVRRAHGG